MNRPPVPTFAKPPLRAHLRRRTVRLRLTLLYGGLFLVSGAGLLAITYLLVSHSTGTLRFYRATFRGGAPKATITIGHAIGSGPRPTPLQVKAQAVHQHAAELHQLLVQSGIGLGLMALVSIALGWLVAGRVLSPLRTMTAATRRISEDNLHERLALPGPGDELKDLADTIDGLLTRLEAAFDAQRRFVANASHELRTPLAMMRTSLDVAVAKPEPPSPEMAGLDDKLRQGLDRADRLLESFLTLARAQHGVLTPGPLTETTIVSLAEISDAAIQARRRAIAEKGIEVQQTIERAPVFGSETLLTRMVENVIDNAIRHNEPAGWISVTTEIDGAVARLVVASGGAPLDESAVRELAQPFRRLGAERTGSENGVGLGLSIVAAIAAAHGGVLELEARRGGGLRVQIELPHLTHHAPGSTPHLNPPAPGRA